MNKKYISKAMAILIIMVIFMSSLTIDSINIAAAESLDVRLSGNSTVEPGKTYNLNLRIPNIKSAAPKGIASFDLTIKYDTSKFDYVSYAKQYKESGQLENPTVSSGNIILLVESTSDPIYSSDIITISFKVKSNATDGSSASFSITAGTFVTVVNNNPVEVDRTLKAKLVEILSNNNLKSLSVKNKATGNSFTLKPSFSKSTTSYTINAHNSVTDVVLAAGAESSVAKVSGTGEKALAVGANKYKIVVTAENGSTKTYTITVNRAAPEPTDNQNPDPTPKPKGTTAKPASTPKSSEGNVEEITPTPGTPQTTGTPTGTPSATLSAANQGTPGLNTSSPSPSPSESANIEVGGTKPPSNTSNVIGYILAIVLGIAIGIVIGYYIGWNKKIKSRFKY